MVEMLLPYGAAINAAAGPNWSGLTALQAAAMGGHLMAVDGLTALQAAAGGGHLDVVRRLLLARANVNATNFWGLTALQSAIGQVVSRPWRSSWT